MEHKSISHKRKEAIIGRRKRSNGEIFRFCLCSTTVQNTQIAIKCTTCQYKPQSKNWKRNLLRCQVRSSPELDLRFLSRSSHLPLAAVFS